MPAFPPPRIIFLLSIPVSPAGKRKITELGQAETVPHFAKFHHSIQVDWSKRLAITKDTKDTESGKQGLG
jgi:hypothetical protein